MTQTQDIAGWPAFAPLAGQVALHFGEGHAAEMLTNLSAATRIEDSLFVAADERANIDRLRRRDGAWHDHERFDLADLLKRAAPDGEADLEGLAIEDGWLWLVGSHARTRRKPEKAEDGCIDLTLLADLKDTRPRCLLARIPLVRDDGQWRPVRRDGHRRAGAVPATKRGNLLSKALKHDPLIAPFTRIPAKEGGVDIEGIAVAGDRVALGMRGPVIATHAVLIELPLIADARGRLRPAGPPWKRLLSMEGLGIRDLKRVGDDLLILAGPSAGLSGPCAVYRWTNWANEPPRDADRVRLHHPERLIDLPFGRGFDHPEGLAVWRSGADLNLLVLHDSPMPSRIDQATGIFTADQYTLPI